MKCQRAVLANFIALAALLAPVAATAQTAGAGMALAEALYLKGRQLMAEGKYAEACPKFAESYRLDRATGTLLNLAACHESEKKLASAWTEFSEAAASARRDNRDDRVEFAEKHMAAIEPRLSRLVVTVAPNAEVPGLQVQLDGVVVLAAAREVPAPVDPGEHVVEAQAPGRKPWSRRVGIDERAQNITITVPLLDLEAPPAPPVPEPKPLPTVPPAAEERARPERPVPASVYIAGGAAVVLAVGAGVTGVVYMNHKDDESSALARRFGVAQVAFVAGAAVAGGVTAYLYWTRPSKSSGAAMLTLAPWLGPSGGGVALAGSL